MIKFSHLEHQLVKTAYHDHFGEIGLSHLADFVRFQVETLQLILLTIFCISQPLSKGKQL